MHNSQVNPPIFQGCKSVSDVIVKEEKFNKLSQKFLLNLNVCQTWKSAVRYKVPYVSFNLFKQEKLLSTYELVEGIVIIKENSLQVFSNKFQFFLESAYFWCVKSL